jgi:DNA-binding NarL/FixJ family response regulator
MKILLVDDHPLFLDGLALLFAQEFPQAEVLQAHSLAAALSTVAAEPAVSWVLLDLGLPDSEGMLALQRLREACPEATCVVMSADERPATILAAIDLGAAGFLPKTTRHGELLRALRLMMGGGVYLPASVLAMQPGPVSGTPAAAESVDALGLSPRQGDVLRLLIEGKPNKAICRDLGLSESTVKTHLAAIFRKLGASSRTQAVVAAARLGLRLQPSAIGH